MSHSNRGTVGVICISITGLTLIYKGITNTIPRDTFGEPRYASRTWYIIAGLVMQLFPTVWLLLLS